MSLENLPESTRAAWLEARDQVAGFLVHIGQKMFNANEGAKSGNNVRPSPRRIAFSVKEGGVIDIAYHLAYDPSGLAEAWSARTAIESSPGLRFLSERIAPGQTASANNVIAMTMTVPEPDSAEGLSAILKETLSEFCLKDIEISVNGQIIPPLWNGWERGMVRGNGRNYSIAMCNGIPVRRTEIKNDAAPESGVIWFITSARDAFMPGLKDSVDDVAATLLDIRPPSVAPGSGSIQTNSDDLSLEARLLSWGLSSLREVTSDWLSSLSPEDASNFLSSVVSGETAYRLPDIHTLDRAIPTGPLSEEMSVFIDMWGGAARQAAKAAGLEAIRIGVCHGLSSWTKAADGVPVLYVDSDKAINWSSQEMLAEAIYMLSGLKEQEALAQGHKFDRARAVSDMFAKADRDDDAYIALRKDLRSKMGQAAVILRDGVPDAAGIVSGLSERLLTWAWPDQAIEAEIAATDICDQASIIPLPTPELAQEPTIRHEQSPAPLPVPVPEPVPEPLPAAEDHATIGRSADLSDATNGRIEVPVEATNGRVDVPVEATNGRVADEVPAPASSDPVPENHGEAVDFDDGGLGDWMSGDFFAPTFSGDEKPSEEPEAIEAAINEDQVRIRPVPVVQSQAAPEPVRSDKDGEESILAGPIDDDFLAGIFSLDEITEQSGLNATELAEAPVLSSPVVSAPADEEQSASGMNDIPVGEPFKDIPVGEPFKDIPVGEPFKDIPVGEPFKDIPVGEPLEEIGLSFFDTSDLLDGFSSAKIAEKTEKSFEPTPSAAPKPVRLAPVRLTPDQMA